MGTSGGSQRVAAASSRPGQSGAVPWTLIAGMAPKVAFRQQWRGFLGSSPDSRSTSGNHRTGSLRYRSGPPTTAMWGSLLATG